MSLAATPSYDGGMDPARGTAEERLTIVPDELQAEMVRAVLVSHGIACLVRRPALGEIQWGVVNVGMGGPREIVVASDDIEAARELLDSPTQDAPVASAAVDAALERRSSRLGRGFGFIVVLLFGVPFALGAIWWLADLLERAA